jgi:acetyltransferase-like isoleucine patch superfamily enzyme
MASMAAPPYYGRRWLAQLTPRGYVAPSARLHHDDVQLGPHVFVGDRVMIYRDRDGGPVQLEGKSLLIADTVIQTGMGGSVRIGSQACIQPRCQLSAYVSSIDIGERVQIAPNCGFYSYDHGTVAGQRIVDQPLQSRGPIVIGDGAWIGFGVVVLSGVRIGAGAVVAAGSVVTRDVPDECIAAGVPARVLRRRAATGDQGATPAPESTMPTARIPR